MFAVTDDERTAAWVEVRLNGVASMTSSSDDDLTILILA
jgi:hypothetical protein